jgi:hypothetical protein
MLVFRCNVGRAAAAGTAPHWRRGLPASSTASSRRSGPARGSAAARRTGVRRHSVRRCSAHWPGQAEAPFQRSRTLALQKH